MRHFSSRRWRSAANSPFVSRSAVTVIPDEGVMVVSAEAVRVVGDEAEHVVAADTVPVTDAIVVILLCCTKYADVMLRALCDDVTSEDKDTAFLGPRIWLPRSMS